MFTVKVIETGEDNEYEKVYACDEYERAQYFGDKREVEDGHTVRSAETAYHHLTLFKGDNEKRIPIPHSVLDKPKTRHIYIMNENGKTIDSF